VTPIRLLLVDDHDIVRAGIRVLLHTFSGIEVVADTGDGLEALSLIGAHHPDIVLLDIGMPGLNGLEVLTRIKHAYPAVRVMMLSMHANEEYVWRALRDGAAGYLLKGANTVEFEQAIRTVAQGDIFLSATVSKYTIANYAGRMTAHTPGLERLTSRQREVLQLIAEGRSTKEIAYQLQISAKTVETHRAQVMERLNIDTIAGLVRYAITVGLITTEH
jgi:DNA-binding NarL/FixJ family response regulator